MEIRANVDVLQRMLRAFVKSTDISHTCKMKHRYFMPDEGVGERSFGCVTV